jgi:hypothetical protein
MPHDNEDQFSAHPIDAITALLPSPVVAARAIEALRAEGWTSRTSS